MAATDLDLLDSPLPWYRGRQVVTVGSDDIVFDAPVAVQANTAGNLVFVDALYREQTVALTAGADVAGPGGGLVAVREIKGTSTVTSVIIGIM